VCGAAGRVRTSEATTHSNISVFNSQFRKLPPSEHLSEILSFALWMRKEGFREATCRSAVEVLKSVDRRADLLDPEAAKNYLAKATFSEGRKERISWDLARFYRWKGIAFEKPRYRRIEKLPFIPLETEIDALISGSGTKTAALLQFLKETGTRCGEAWNAKWSDIDLERNTLLVQPEKHSKSRILKISNRLIAMLNQLPKNSTFIFHVASKDPIQSLMFARRNFEKQRSTLARKLQNPRLLQIHLHTFRHFYATKEYARTKDILHVMRQLGHHNIIHTLTYTHLVDFPSDEYVCKVATTIQEATTLIENGFDFVTEFQSAKLFRKRK
jgi:integrase/recombinase XerD